MVKTTSWCSNGVSEWGRNVVWMTMNVAWLMVTAWVFSETVDLLGFLCTTNSQVHREWFGGGRRWGENPVSSSSVVANALLMPEIRCTDWFEMTQTRYNHCIHHTRCLSCQLETGNWGYRSHEFTKLDNRRLEKLCLVWWVSISAASFG